MLQTGMLQNQARVASLEESLAGEQASARDSAAARTSLELSLREQQAAVREANGKHCCELLECMLRG